MEKGIKNKIKTEDEEQIEYLINYHPTLLGRLVDKFFDIIRRIFNVRNV
jgi:hypothetical protein